VTPIVRVTVNGQPFASVLHTREDEMAYRAADAPSLPLDWQPTTLTVAWLVRAQKLAHITGLAFDITRCRYRMRPEAAAQVETVLSRMDYPDGTIGCAFRSIRVETGADVPWCDFDVTTDGGVTSDDRTRIPNPHCRTCADGPHTGMHDLPPARSARVWTRALGTVRDGRFGVYPARVESAAGQVDGVRIEGRSRAVKAQHRNRKKRRGW
jgi:hypothetical protein